MPIYEYECKECGHQFEAIRKISDGPPDACPACGAGALHKLVSKAAFRLKGTGWYETDFKSKPKDKKADSGDKSDGDSKSKKEDKSTGDKSDSGSSSKSETKSTAGSAD